MNPEQFAYWLQGFVELNGGEITPEQWKSVKEHLATVFKKVTTPVKHPMPMDTPWVSPPYNPNQPQPHLAPNPGWLPGEVIC